ncbi:universal stress protein [uncultured Roseivirga sp.]|jgi:nucleotide-binding universal stress UspA family protein|uniref:universal stress protein n=1 Tax=uncultured Roseivirga sp. TaxID=543088 RepID=UPI0030DCC829|tara:strand:+ start:569 stop:1417 length:849 start_codon:yes stop_codon:yes gene_type:complete
MKTILVPIDFSEQSKYALNFAAQLAKKGNLQVHAINIIEGPQNHTFNTMGDGFANESEDYFFLKQLIDKTKENMNALLQSKAYSGIDVIGSVEVGNPYQSISKAIADHEADLVVMGSKGASGIDEVLIGSNTEKVVRFAKCPVVTIKSEVNLTGIKNIVLATNLEEDQTKLIQKLKEMQKITGAKLHLVKINTPNSFHTQRQMEEEFAKYIKEHGLGNIQTAIYNESSEEDGILFYAEDVKADLIAIGTHGRTGLLHLLSGSIAEDLVNHSQIPVWTLSRKG